MATSLDMTCGVHAGANSFLPEAGCTSVASAVGVVCDSCRSMAHMFVYQCIPYLLGRCIHHYVKSMSDRWDTCQVRERERVYPNVACGAMVQILSFYFLFRIFNHFYLLNHTIIFDIFYIFEFLKPRALV